MAGAKGRSGGFRVGAGRKPPVGATVALRQPPGRARSEPPPKPKAPPVEVPVPADLPDDQRVVWDALAPHAKRARTLTLETAATFRDLCEAIVVKRSMLAQITADGLTFEDVSVDGAGVEHRRVVSHPLIAKHIGMMVRVEAGMGRFLLAPNGKPVAIAEPEPDEWAEFDGPQLVKGAAK